MNDFNLSKPRFSYAQNMALNYLIKKSNNILPISPDFLLQQECCSLQTYQTHSNITNSDIEYLSKTFGSKDAKTFYWTDKNFGIVFFNDDQSYYRKRWTFSHELGHIVLNHYIDFDLSINSTLQDDEFKLLDREADAFASNLLAPNSIIALFMLKYGIQKRDIVGIYTILRCFFRLSKDASFYKAKYITQSSNINFSEIDQELIKKYQPHINSVFHDFPLYAFEALVKTKSTEFDSYQYYINSKKEPLSIGDLLFLNLYT